MIAKNITKQEVDLATAAIHKLISSEQIDDNTADILFRCLGVITDLQHFGEETSKQNTEMVCGPTGCSLHTIKMVKSEDAHVIPNDDNITDYLLGLKGKPSL